MKDSSMRTLLRLRQAAVDEARQALAACLRTEAAARAALRELDAAVEREAEAATGLDVEDRAVEQFAVWLRRMRIDRERGEEALATAEAGSAEARAVLSVSMAAAESLERLIEQRTNARLVADEARDRRALDEVRTRSR